MDRSPLERLHSVQLFRGLLHWSFGERGPLGHADVPPLTHFILCQWVLRVTLYSSPQRECPSVSAAALGCRERVGACRILLFPRMLTILPVVCLDVTRALGSFSKNAWQLLKSE